MPQLSVADDALLAYLLEEEGIELYQTIPRRQGSAESPLSFSQQRLWFLSQLEPSSPAYNLPRAFHLRGPLNVRVLEQSLSEIVRRHEVLRTSFETVEGEAVQVVNPAQPICIARENLSELPLAERDERIRQRALEEAQLPFDLTCAPFVRLKLLQLAEDEHALLLTMHHIVSDEWSTGIFMNEIGILYDAFLRHAPSPLTELPIQYADYAEWQAGWLRTEEVGEQLTYWKKQLAGELPLLELATDRKRPPMQTFNGASRSLTLGAHLYEGVKKLSGQEDATLFMTLSAAFTLLLHRYTGQEDILIGSPIAGRERTEVEGLIGFFVNTLVLRTDFSGSPSFRGLLKQVREVALGAYAHQSLPFELLVRELQPERSLSHTPMFQVVFAMRSAQKEEMQLPGANLELRPLHFGMASAKFDMFLSVDDTGGNLHANLIYNSDLFDGATVERMLRHFQTLLESILAHPEQPVSSLAFVTQTERKQLLVEWNETSRDLPRDFCVHQLFERRVKLGPDAVALVFGEEQLTYAELNRRSNQLAHYLRSWGVGADVRVGLCVERSVDMVVALLGILKAGGAYVPLDAELPPLRLSFLIDDSGVEVILASGTSSERLPDSGVPVVRLDEAREEIARQSSANPNCDVHPDNLAYVIYTSASMGMPKGVEVAHRSVLRLVCEPNYVRLDETQCIMQLAPLAFDASTFEIWGALLHGARSVLYAGGRPTPRELGEAIEKHGVRTMWLTASLYNAMMDEAPNALAGLEQLVIGGEALSVAHVQKGIEHLPQTQIINGYGPTEATTFTCCYPIPLDSGQWPGSVPIGRPISNTDVYVLDAQLNVMPVGIVGELYVGGEGLARGYLNGADITAERFIPHLYSTKAGARLYRTGDLVRYLSDGNIEFVGRADTQVKVRGFRIELGEIESALGRHAGVLEAIVLVREDERGDKRLVAYLVCEGENAPPVTELREHLRERLPEYMIPFAFVMLDAMPLTPNGKADRRALPAPQMSRPELEGAFVAPRSPVEEMVAQIWSDVLGLSQIGVHDNFFALGGHSLLATTTVTRLRAAFGVDLPLRAIFETPTVSDLSELLEATRRKGQNWSVPPLVRVSREQPLPLSFAQQRLWFHDQLTPGGNAAYNVQIAVRLQGQLHVAALEQALNEIVQRHESLRTNFTIADWQPVQVISAARTIPLPLRDLSHVPEGEREAEALRLTTEATQLPFDLSSDTLLRVMLVRLNDDEHVLVLVIHHIISDAWSMGVLIQELAALYEACREGRPSPLAQLSVQYADYAHWQREWLQGDVLEKHLAYWRRNLSNFTELQLATDRPRPAVQSFRGAHRAFALPADLSVSLKELSKREGVTLYMLMLAAFKTLLHYYSQSEEIVVGTDIANRSHVETEGLIGFFANQLVIRTSLAGDPSFTEILSRVREVSLGAFVHQDLPFEKVVEALRPDRDLNRNPLFQIMFGFSNTAPPVVALPELRLSGIGIEKGTAVFDLSLYLTDTAHGINGMLRYSTDLFDAATIERMREHYEILLAQVVAQPDARLGALRQVLAEADGERQSQTAARLKTAGRQLFKNVKRRAAGEAD